MLLPYPFIEWLAIEALFMNAHSCSFSLLRRRPFQYGHAWQGTGWTGAAAERYATLMNDG